MEKVLEIFLYICTSFGFFMIGIVAFGVISNFVESFKRWNKKRKIERQKYCSRCIHGYPSKACITCKRNPSYMDNWRTRDGFDRG